jgi:hypothetical protein
MLFALEQLLSTTPSAPMIARASHANDPTQVINVAVRHLIERSVAAVVLTANDPKSAGRSGSLPSASLRGYCLGRANQELVSLATLLLVSRKPARCLSPSRPSL